MNTSEKQEKLTRRQFCKSAGVVISAAVAGSAALPGCGPLERQKSGKHPNLLFVFSDQQSRDMLGCYGNEDIITPNLNHFASEGIRFEHCVSSSPVCTPFRGMLMSGQHPLYCGVLHNDYPLLANNGRYFGHVLKEAGYRMGYIGKWHLLGGDRDRPIPQGPMRYGFDNVFLSNNCHVDFRPSKCFYWNDDGQKVYFDEWEVYGQTRQALKFLDQCSNEQPFCLFVSWHPPHNTGLDMNSLVFQYDTIPELLAMYDLDKIKLRPSVKDCREIRRAYHGYYAMCSGVDIAFGRLMDKLREKGLEDNTLVVFTSDHGDNLASYDYRICKDHPEDTSTRIPFLMRWPKRLPRGQVSELLFSPMDMMPTILALMSRKIPRTVQGQDLSAAILKKQNDAVQSIPLFFYKPAWKGVYTRDVTYGFGQIGHFAHDNSGKLIMKNVPVRVLYDRSKDPYQLNNLYGNKDAAALQHKMEKLTKEWMERFGDPGVSVEQLDRLYRYPDNRLPEDTKEPGFPGRPIDLVKQIA